MPKEGSKLTTIECYIAALKNDMDEKNYRNQQYTFATILETEVNIDKLFNCGEIYFEQTIGKIKNVFWKDVLKAHLKLSLKREPTNVDEFLSSPLYYNKNIKIGTSSCFNKSWFDKGIHFINDIVKEDGTFYTQYDLQVMYNININFLHYYGLIKAVKTWGKRLEIRNIGHKLNIAVYPLTH